MLEEKEKKLQKLYMQFQILEQHIKQMQQQAATLNAQLLDLISTTHSLDDLQNVKPGTEILVPISSGVYIKGELKDNKNLIVNVGANTTVRKSLDDTKKIVEMQAEEMKGLQKQALEELQRLTNQAAIIEREMNNLASDKNV